MSSFLKTVNFIPFAELTFEDQASSALLLGGSPVHPCCTWARARDKRNMSSPFAITDVRKIGIGLTAFGLAFSILGVALFFDKGLLAMGNVLYLAGVMLIIGPTRSVRFFFQKRKLKASIFFFAGMAVVLFGYPIIGMAVEIFGFVNLFGDFFPVVIAFLRRAPVTGKLLNMPVIRNVCHAVVLRFIPRYWLKIPTWVMFVTNQFLLPFPQIADKLAGSSTKLPV